MDKAAKITPLHKLMYISSSYREAVLVTCIVLTNSLFVFLSVVCTTQVSYGPSEKEKRIN